ncbi:unnamed protein product [Closterium sp. NIES-54]
MMEKFFSFMSFYGQHQQGAPAQLNNSNNNNTKPMSLDGSSYARGNQQQPTFAPYEPQRGSRWDSHFHLLDTSTGSRPRLQSRRLLVLAHHPGDRTNKSISNNSTLDCSRDNIGSSRDNIGSSRDNIGSIKDNISSSRDNIGSNRNNGSSSSNIDTNRWSFNCIGSNRRHSTESCAAA